VATNEKNTVGTGMPASPRARADRDKFKMAFDQREVGSRLIGLTQRKEVSLSLAHVMLEVSLPNA
jgi:hypothetical protein